ncbi:hypothetical protein EPM78_07450 [Neisseria gonorrhoeae]|uniref:Transposase n=1 Tax=Neisseria gonorrhoeae TaxID=485 RepID=A0AAX2TQU7_NEIGO|nr:hypothetical protein A6J43_13605 [Neisseria gonorrhoeae]EEH61373.1 predicted protein [Neisseria gonorrhoeae 1291]EEZ42872.1 conserved hypothetical protein [Neisseria gonorrhoeae 35/02]EEZ49394.1 predicted protein [Neisseria gonorrhoeae PID18]EEZ51711.1 predicted protein [Neisseria gonorrhoeae PID1]EEZ54055.1 predicted protein [Neisseria gonorrhoeae PID332]EEZ56223.1 predicted protein [Neisseria gonorrhoeae SK-92-679]KMW64609.1 hypothetical protein NGCG_00356 [Neisseria gonorrhoeae DGI18]
MPPSVQRNPAQRQAANPVPRRIRIDADAHPQTRTARYTGNRHQNEIKNLFERKIYLTACRPSE